MPSRTDLLHSYQFRSRRVLAALVMRETDPSQSPLRRGVGAVFAGVMIAILAGAGFGIYGLVTRVGGDAWRTPNAVVVERETGATYVYRDDVLIPTLNLASAMLAAGQQHPTVHRVSSASLADVARGLPIGIPGAPDSLPPADRQLPLPWTVCAGPQTTTQVALAVGVGVDAATPLGDQALLVRDVQRDETHLVWNGHRFRILSPEAVVPQIFGFRTPVDVGPAFIDAIPAGLDIAPIRVDRPGQESAAVADYANGDLLVLSTAGAGDQYLLVLDDGLYPLTAVDKAVLDASASDPIQPIQIPSAVQAPTSALVPSGPRDSLPPGDAPSLAGYGEGELICATTATDLMNPQITVGGAVEGLDRAIRTAGTSTNRTPLANRVLVPAGRVAVVRAVATAGATAGSYLIVTDLGFAYPVPQADVLALLGYSAPQAVDVPASLAALLPAGPVLDPAAAREAAGPAAAA